MAYVLFALLLFCISVMMHVFFCRHTSQPGLHARTFILIAALAMGVYAAGIYAAGQWHLLDPGSIWGMPFMASAGIVFVLLVPVYLSFYVLTQLMSPSKKILLSLARRGNLSRADILGCIEEEEFIHTRLSDLVTSGCVQEVNGRYRLSLSGQKIAAVLSLMQAVLGRDIGG